MQRIHPDKARRIQQAIRNTAKPACVCLRAHRIAYQTGKEKPGCHRVEVAERTHRESGRLSDG